MSVAVAEPAFVSKNMADERGSELGSGREVENISSEAVTPVLVSSGSRPLQISVTPGSNKVDGRSGCLLTRSTSIIRRRCKQNKRFRVDLQPQRWES